MAYFAAKLTEYTDEQGHRKYDRLILVPDLSDDEFSRLEQYRKCTVGSVATVIGGDE